VHTLPQQPDEILNRLRRIGLVRAGMPVLRLTEGTVNTVWRVAVAPTGEAVLRVGPGGEAVAAGPSWLRAEALACEAIVLDRVRAAVPGVPVPIAAGFRDRSWLLQALLPGAPLSQALPVMAAEAKRDIWRQVGALLRALHGVDGTWFGTPDGRHRFPDWPAMVRADAEGLRDDARRFGLDLAPFDRLQAKIAAGADALGEVARPAVVHSDLDPRHVFVRETELGREIAGVIDWEYARYADPHSESLLVGMLARPEGDPARAALLAGYGLDPTLLTDPAFWRRQAIYRGIAEGWALTDAARLEQVNLVQVKRQRVEQDSQ
jgi:aminoglycoside phosphotransferase (APT) family kinase protein